jgi:hypothetical protein
MSLARCGRPTAVARGLRRKLHPACALLLIAHRWCRPTAHETFATLRRRRHRGRLFLGASGFCSRLGMDSCGFESDGSDESVEIVNDALIEAIELRSSLRLKPGIGFDGAKKARGERGVDAFEQL